MNEEPKINASRTMMLSRHNFWSQKNLRKFVLWPAMISLQHISMATTCPWWSCISNNYKTLSIHFTISSPPIATLYHIEIWSESPHSQTHRDLVRKPTLSNTEIWSESPYSRTQRSGQKAHTLKHRDLVGKSILSNTGHAIMMDPMGRRKSHYDVNWGLHSIRHWGNGLVSSTLGGFFWLLHHQSWIKVCFMATQAHIMNNLPHFLNSCFHNHTVSTIHFVVISDQQVEHAVWGSSVLVVIE
jgi:hypothetical protein